MVKPKLLTITGPFSFVKNQRKDGHFRNHLQQAWHWNSGDLRLLIIVGLTLAFSI
jgi:hypothetical protein